MDFASQRNHLETCLLNGVVPSVSAADNVRPPTPIAIINASYTFYLTSLEKLLRSLGKDPHNIEDRSIWKQKVEMWTQKALEDIQLLDQLERVKSNGGTIKKQDPGTPQATH